MVLEQTLCWSVSRQKLPSVNIWSVPVICFLRLRCLEWNMCTCVISGCVVVRVISVGNTFSPALHLDQSQILMTTTKKGSYVKNWLRKTLDPNSASCCNPFGDRTCHCYCLKSLSFRFVATTCFRDLQHILNIWGKWPDGQIKATEPGTHQEDSRSPW